MQHFNSFQAFKEWLNSSWMPANPTAVQLDGSTFKNSNRKVLVTMDLADIPNLTARISFHGDTTIEALRVVARSSIEDFIIVPPQPKATFWRLHLKPTHDFSNEESANGLYAYIK